MIRYLMHYEGFKLRGSLWNLKICSLDSCSISWPINYNFIDKKQFVFILVVVLCLFIIAGILIIPSFQRQQRRQIIIIISIGIPIIIFDNFIALKLMIQFRTTITTTTILLVLMNMQIKCRFYW